MSKYRLTAEEQASFQAPLLFYFVSMLHWQILNMRVKLLSRP